MRSVSKYQMTRVNYYIKPTKRCNHIGLLWNKNFHGYTFIEDTYKSLIKLVCG